MGRLIEKLDEDIKRLSKSNSISFGSMKFYLKKIGSSYVAYDVDSKVKIVATSDKDRLINWLSLNIERIEERLENELGIQRKTNLFSF